MTPLNAAPSPSQQFKSGAERSGTESLNISDDIGTVVPEAASLVPVKMPPLVIALPARNEEARISRTLHALGVQQAECPETCWIVVLVNNSTDATAEVARQVGRTLSLPVEVIEEWFPDEQAHVGHARGRALHLAAERLEHTPDGLIASIDADTVAAPDWTACLRRALRSADAVGGRIFTLPEEKVLLPRRLRRLQLQDAAYHLLAAKLVSQLDPDPADPWPRHHQHFGANLGLRLSAWRQLEAWPDVRCLEDVALIGALTQLDLRIRHCPRARVWTSSRTCGRVEVGLSTQLREWNTLQLRQETWLVPGAAQLRAAATANAALRCAWIHRRSGGQVRLASLAELWMVPQGDLNAALDASTFGLAREQAMTARCSHGRWAQHFPPVALEQALADLRTLLAAPSGVAAENRVLEFA